MKVKLHAFETSALSRKSTVSFKLQPLRIRRKVSLPTRQMIGRDADSIRISLPRRHPWPSSRYLYWMSEQFSISSHLWTNKLYIWKNTKVFEDGYFFLRREVTLRLVVVKKKQWRTSNSCYWRAKLVRVLNFPPRGTRSLRLEVEVKSSKQRCQCSGRLQSAGCLVWHWLNTLLSALLDTPRKTGFNESFFLCSLCAKSLIANY